MPWFEFDGKSMRKVTVAEIGESVDGLRGGRLIDIESDVPLESKDDYIRRLVRQKRSESLDKLYAMLVASADKDLEYLEMSG